MQMNDQVLIALEVLRNFAENDFERHRIDVLEQDLTAPPKVEQIDDKHLKFNGVTYSKKKDNHYYSAEGIQRAIWEYYYGKIPVGYHVHHCNLNPADNAISNLQMLTNSEHRRLHIDILKAESALVQRVCKFCGKSFTSASFFNSAEFCSTACRTKYYLTSEDYRENRICPICGKEFSISKSLNNVCCSRACSAELANQKRINAPIQKKCPFCGKVFSVDSKHKRKVFCSRSCAAKSAHPSSPPIKKYCVICGKEFTPPKGHPDTKTCSHSCTARFAWQTKKSKIN